MAKVEFREGEREIPDHLAELMRGLKTYTMTYDEAVKAANDALARGVFTRARTSMVHDHIRQFGGRG